jgi:hypothetical protein
MAMIRAALHSHPATHGDPAAVLRCLNEHFAYLWDTAMFATAHLRGGGRGAPRAALVVRRSPAAAAACAKAPRWAPAGGDAVPPLLMMPSTDPEPRA